MVMNNAEVALYFAGLVPDAPAHIAVVNEDLHYGDLYPIEVYSEEKEDMLIDTYNMASGKFELWLEEGVYRFKDAAGSVVAQDGDLNQAIVLFYENI